MSQVTCLPIIAGEPWQAVVKIYDDTLLRSRWAVQNISPLGGSILIKGATATTFAIGVEFTLSGNSDPATNRTYTVATATNVGADVVVTVAASVVSLAVAAVDSATSRVRVTTTSLASVSRFADGATVALSGNANDASNTAYRVVSSYVPSSPSDSLWVEVTPSLSPSATVSGNLVVPTMSPSAGQTAIATLNSPTVVNVSTWIFSAQVRASLAVDSTLLATATVDTASASTGTVTINLTAVQTAAICETDTVAFVDMLGVSPSALTARSLRSIWTQGSDDPRLIRPVRADNYAVRFGLGAVPLRNLPVVTERD